MPYEWVKPAAAPEQSGAVGVCEDESGSSPLLSPAGPCPPQLELLLWPYRSLSLRGFAIFILSTSALVLVPLLSMIGSPVLWAVLPFFIAMMTGLWFAFGRSYSDGRLTERLQFWDDRVRLIREGPRTPRQEWEANPHWVRITLHKEGGPVPNYLTLKGQGRAVELGSFLSEDERAELLKELRPLFGPRA